MKEKKTRQLAAVMFTDIVGYTALMQGDEHVAVTIRARHRQVFQEEHKRHQGEIIQYYGDGTLSVFKSAIKACECALAIQNELQTGILVPLRIGLHLGDIVFDDTEIYGDGVNYASRIESLSTAGAILVSAKINDELRNYSAISTVSLGHFNMKNITKPVEVFAISNAGIQVPKPSEIKGKQKAANRTVAVLPFVNLSANQENEYFSDGITEEIINALSKIKSLKVTSRTSSFFFKNKRISIKEIGKELGVSIILEGSIRLAGNTVRITAQLIQAEEDYHFWSETWDRELINIFEIQDEISLIIADKLREQFGHFEIQDHLVQKQTDNLMAYEYALKAKFHSQKWNQEDVKLAIEFYEKALALDPNHTESYLGLADCYSFLATTGFLPYEESWAKTIEFTNRAWESNNELSGVNYQLANQAFFVENNYQKSLEHVLKAIQINPNNAEAQQFTSFLYIIAGNKIKSQAHLDIAISINPLSEETRFFNAYYHYMIEDYEKCMTLLNQCLQANNKSIPAHAVKCNCLIQQGQYDDVIAYFDTIPPEVVTLPEKTGQTALAYAMKKDHENTAIYLNRVMILAEEPDGFIADAFLFMLYAVLGEHDKAFAWVEDAISKKCSLLHLRYMDPIVKALKGDPRYPKFQQIIYQVDIIQQELPPNDALLDHKTASIYAERLLAHMAQHSTYLDPSLTLRKLANQVDIHPNQLSWLLNNTIGKNFNEFINKYRLEAFKVKAIDPENTHVTIEGLAFDSGFNSKTVFNTFFKKATGYTPKQFLKRQH